MDETDSRLKELRSLIHIHVPHLEGIRIICIPLYPYPKQKVPYLDDGKTYLTPSYLRVEAMVSKCFG